MKGTCLAMRARCELMLSLVLQIQIHRTLDPFACCNSTCFLADDEFQPRALVRLTCVLACVADSYCSGRGFVVQANRLARVCLEEAIKYGSKVSSNFAQSKC